MVAGCFLRAPTPPKGGPEVADVAVAADDEPVDVDVVVEHQSPLTGFLSTKR